MNLSAEDIFEFHRAARPGAALVYHVGVCLGERPERFPSAVHAIRYLYNEGAVTLLQRRAATQGQRRFEYIAKWLFDRRKPSSAPVHRPIGKREKRMQFRWVSETRFDVPAEIRDRARDDERKAA